MAVTIEFDFEEAEANNVYGQLMRYSTFHRMTLGFPRSRLASPRAVPRVPTRQHLLRLPGLLHFLSLPSGSSLIAAFLGGEAVR